MLEDVFARKQTSESDCKYDEEYTGTSIGSCILGYPPLGIQWR